MPPSEETAADVLMTLINRIKRDLPYDKATAQIVAALYAAAAAQVKGPAFRPFEIGWTPDLYALYDLLKEELSTHTHTKENQPT
jgi:hypothetical protein